MADSAQGDTDVADRPVIELFVKAAADKRKNGNCPICHRYFLAFYILRMRGMVDLVVTTFTPDNPPPEVLAFSNGKRWPLVKIHKGSVGGRGIGGMECDTVDEIELLLDMFECPDMLARRESKDEERAERTFEDLIKQFNLFMMNNNAPADPVIRILGRINEYLRNNGTKFLLTDRLGRADCYLLPLLQHVRVAGMAYKGFDLPLELVDLWRYMKDAYATDAVKESTPADSEIIQHYSQKVQTMPREVRNKVFLMGDQRTFNVPDSVANGQVNGD